MTATQGHQLPVLNWGLGHLPVQVRLVLIDIDVVDGVHA